MTFSEAETITWQQRFAYERLLKNWDVARDQNSKLDAKALTIFVASGGLMTFAFERAGIRLATINAEAVVPLLFAGLLTLGTQIAAMATWMTTRTRVPGDPDVNTLFAEFIAVEEQDTYNAALQDLNDAVNVSAETNRKKAKQFDLAAGLLIAQVVATIAVLAFASAA